MPELVTAYFPNIQVLAQGSCNGCKKLKLVEIGEYCYRVENMAFFNCTALDTLILRRTVSITQMPQGALVGTPIEAGKGYIYVPKSLKTTYETDSNYAELGYKFRAIEDYPDIANSVVAATIEEVESE
jgi:phosphoribosylformylglycinamidine (FGAM) synthase-like amidotransferase family enzyme